MKHATAPARPAGIEREHFCHLLLPAVVEREGFCRLLLLRVCKYAKTTVTAMPTTPTITAARASDDICSGLLVNCDAVACETVGNDVEFSDGRSVMLLVGGIVVVSYG